VEGVKEEKGLKKEDATGDEEIKVYSDGSAQDGKVGAAAVLVRPGQATRTLHFHLGAVEHHTVFEAELVGLMLGLHLIKTEKSGGTSYALGADNLAAISALATPSNRSGHFLADLCLTAATSIHKSRGTANYKLKVRWTAGHVGIEGNELADKEAKAATEGKTLPVSSLPKVLRKPLRYNKSAAKQNCKAALDVIWKKEWGESPHTTKLKRFDPSIPSPKYIKLISDPKISRKGASWIYQFRVGHLPLNAYLHRFKRSASASCPACGYHSKNTQHFLLDCPAYAHERWTLVNKSRPGEKDFAKLLSNPKTLPKVITFIHETGRFTHDRKWSRSVAGEREEAQGENTGRNTQQ